MSLGRVLVVEDEPATLKRLVEFLKAMDFEVPVVASTGAEAIRRAEEARPDVVMMDINLPGDLDGVAVARYLRSSHHVPVVYLTASADEKTLQRAKETEPYGYLLKPFDERQLRATLEMALYKHRMEARLREAEARFTALLKCTPDAVVSTEETGRVTLFSTAAVEWTGLTEAAAVGQKLLQALPLTNEDGQWVDVLHPVLHERRPQEPSQVLWLTGTAGVRRKVGVTTAPLKDARGKLMGALLAVRDLSSDNVLATLQADAQEQERAQALVYPDALLHVRADGQVLSAVGKGAQHGAFSQARVGKKLWEELPALVAEAWGALLGKALTTGVVQEWSGAWEGPTGAVTAELRLVGGGRNDAWAWIRSP